MQDTLYEHNVYRRMHDVLFFVGMGRPHCTEIPTDTTRGFEHSASEFRMQGGESCVENLGIGRPTVTLQPSLRNCCTLKFTLTEGLSGLVDCFSDATGHYTEVVWRSTTRIGCGGGHLNHTSDGETKEWFLLVCQYCAAGNTEGLFSENVLAPVKIAAECGATATSTTTSATNSDGCVGPAVNEGYLLPHRRWCV